MEATLWSSIERLAPLQPHFVSVTYGAGGSTRERTHTTVARLVRETRLKPAAHLTCVAATTGRNRRGGALLLGCGRAPRRGPARRPCRRARHGLRAASRRLSTRPAISSPASSASGDFEVSVSAYPEKHPEAASLDADIDALKAKVDCGADRAITQFFFDNDLYFRYLDRVRARGINIPIVPGIVPVQNFKQTANFAAKTGASVPDWLAARFDGLDNDVETRKLIAAAVAAEQVIDLVDRGVNEFHFYTMNRADLVYAICHLLGLARPGRQGAAAA